MKLLQTWRAKPVVIRPGLRLDVVLALTVSVLLILFLISPPSYPHGCGGADLARVQHPRDAWGAMRDDAMIVTIMRDGNSFFGPDRVPQDELSEKLRTARQDRPLPLYIKADARATYGMVSRVIDAAQAARIPRVVFLVEKRGDR